jgi:hypothetical protein
LACRMPFRRTAEVMRLFRRGPGGLSRPRMGPVGAMVRPVFGGDPNGRASDRIPAAPQVPAWQAPAGGLGWHLAADRQVVVEFCGSYRPMHLGALL